MGDSFMEPLPVADALVTTASVTDATPERNGGGARLAAGGAGGEGATLETPANALKPGLARLHDALTGKSSWTSLPTGYTTETWVSVILAGLLGGIVLGMCLGLHVSLRGEDVGGRTRPYAFWQKTARTVPGKTFGTYTEADLTLSTATSEASIVRPQMISVESQRVGSRTQLGMHAGDTVHSTGTRS